MWGFESVEDYDLYISVLGVDFSPSKCVTDSETTTVSIYAWLSFVVSNSVCRGLPPCCYFPALHLITIARMYFVYD